MSRLQAFPTDSTIESFANEYKEARDNNNEKNVKFIQYNNADHPRTKQLREKIREKLFDDFFAGDVETKPFLVGERVVLDDAIAILDGSTIKFTKDLHNGDEVTVEAELTKETNTSYKDGILDTSPTYEGIPVNILKVKTDKGNEYSIVMEHPTSRNAIKQAMIKGGIYKEGSGEENRIAQEMFTEGIGAAYLINAHKAQGSTYDTVYVDYENIMRSALDSKDIKTGEIKRWGPDFLTRVKALYVATSRPRNKLVLVGSGDLSFGTGEQLEENIKIKDDIENLDDPPLKDAIDDASKDELKSMDDLPKIPTKTPEDLGSITEGNFMRLFNKFKVFSAQYYANAQEMLGHTETLETVLSILSEGITEIGGIRATLQEVDGITQGEYDIATKSMTVNLSNGAPFNVNQSPQEVYVHELSFNC